MGVDVHPQAVLPQEDPMMAVEENVAVAPLTAPQTPPRAQNKADAPQKKVAPKKKADPPPPAPEPPVPQVQVFLDQGWTDFSEQECKQVRDNVESGTLKFAMQIHGAMYIIEVSGKEGTQTNAATKKVRKLRILDPVKEDAAGGQANRQRACGGA